MEIAAKKVKINNRMRPYGRAWSDGIMEINMKRGDVIDTIIHENLHLSDLQMPHGKVYNETDKIESKLTLRSAGELLLKAHDRMLNPQHVREVVRTVSSKVISSIIK